MSSFIYIEFDTTSPEVDIYIPLHTTVKSILDITIESNEDISDFQEIYIVDCDGVRHDYTFQREGGALLVGIVNFINYPIGLATVYARLKDEVNNVSNLVSKSIMVRESTTIFRLEVKHSCGTIDTSMEISKITDSNNVSRIDLKEAIKEVR